MLPKPPTPLRSVNFRHTTPGSGLVFVTNHKRQPISELFDPTYPGAHLPLHLRRSLAPRWISPHLTLHAFPKAFLSKPDVPYPKPYKLRPYPAPLRRRLEEEQQSSTDMSMQVVLFNARVVLRPAMRAKIKRRLKEVIRLIVTRGAAVEDSRGGPKLVFRAEDVGADKWIVPGALLNVYDTANHRDIPHAVCGATWSFTHRARFTQTAHPSCRKNSEGGPPIVHTTISVGHHLTRFLHSSTVAGPFGGQSYWN